jgi:SAM-dependent methyltransferase
MEHARCQVDALRGIEDELLRFLAHNIPKGSVVLEIGCEMGFLFGNLPGIKGIGTDISEKMIELARRNYPDIVFICDDAEEQALDGKVMV